MIKNYLFLAPEKEGLEDVNLTDETLTVKDQEEDGFSRYYNPDERGKKKKKNHANFITRK